MKADLHDKRALGRVEAWVSIIGNVVLFAAKYLLGLRAQSIALQADAFHTLSDVGTSAVVLFGSHTMALPPDAEHPYGHGRWEQISTLVIAVLLALVGFNFIGAAYDKFVNFAPVRFSWPVFGVFALSVIAKEAMARYAVYLGKRADSPMIIADAWHHRSDAIASALVLLPLFFPRSRWVDPVFGFLVALLIIWVAVSLFRESSSRLLGNSLSPDEVGEIERVVRHVPGVKSLHRVECHDYVAQRVLTIHVEVDRTLSVEDSHQIEEAVERQVEKALGYQTVIVHVEPQPEVSEGS